MKRFLLPFLLLGIICVSGCGGMSDAWEKDKKAQLSFSSFDGGGPEYACHLEAPELVTVESRRVYKKADHQQIDGAGYTVVFTFTGQKPGETILTVSSGFQNKELPDQHYLVTVDQNLTVTLTEWTPDASLFLPSASAVLALDTGNGIFYSVPADTAAAGDLLEKLNTGAVELHFHAGERGMKSTLPWSIGEQTGLLLFSRDGHAVLCLETDGQPGEQLADFGEWPAERFDHDLLTVCLWLEWSE